MANSAKEYMVVYRSGARTAASQVLATRGGVSFSNEFDSGEGDIDLRSMGTDPVVYAQLDMAAVTMDDDAAAGVRASRSDSILFIEEVRQYQVQLPDEPAGGRAASLDVDGEPPVTPSGSAGPNRTTGLPGIFTYGPAGSNPTAGLPGIPAGNFPGNLPSYLQGYVQGVTGLAGSLMSGQAGIGSWSGEPAMGVATAGGTPGVQDSPTLPAFPTPGAEFGAASSTGGFTWGLEAIRASVSRLTGAGVKVAILDTGFDFGHPDFSAGRFGGKKFFITNTASDVHGHGTHCAGTACGPRSMSGGYGVAPEAILFIGKVMNDQGTGDTKTIAAGIDWALQNGCRVCSISIGAQQEPSRVIEMAAQRAIQKNMAIIAAAGNDSKRPTIKRPVSDPANCSSVLAVAALRQQGGGFALSNFSNGALPSRGWSIDLAGPGENVYSSYPVHKGGFARLNGTSMATPHVAGVGALIVQSRPDWPGFGIMNALIQLTAPLPIPVGQVGRGLVQAPQSVDWNLG